MAVDLHGALAAPAEAGFAGEVALEDGAGVHVGALGAAVGGEEVGEGAEFGFDEVVVVVVPGVAGDSILSLRLLAVVGGC